MLVHTWYFSPLETVLFSQSCREQLPTQISPPNGLQMNGPPLSVSKRIRISHTLLQKRILLNVLSCLFLFHRYQDTGMLMFQEQPTAPDCHKAQCLKIVPTTASRQPIHSKLRATVKY